MGRTGDTAAPPGGLEAAARPGATTATPPLVVVAEFCAASGLERLRAAGCQVLYAPDLARDPARLRRQLARADALIVRNQIRVDGDLLRHGPRLRVIGRLGTGLDNIDREAVAGRGITVVYAPGANARAVAEFVLGQMLALARRLVPAARLGASGQWARQALMGTELSGAEVGILGLGRIGRELVPLLRPLVASISTFHPRRGPADPEWSRLGVRWRPLDDLLASADYLVVLLPLRPDTRHLLDAGRLARLKPGARLVVTGRGGVVDEAALARLLEAGRLAGAALDVRALEPPGPRDPLRDLPGVLLTPHIAGLTAQAQDRVAIMVAADVLRVLAGQPALHPAWPAQGSATAAVAPPGDRG
ncbi:MAG TPA: hydroxyacid dehydrogenase [Thermaerobacter sp.]